MIWKKLNTEGKSRAKINFSLINLAKTYKLISWSDSSSTFSGALQLSNSIARASSPSPAVADEAALVILASRASVFESPGAISVLTMASDSMAVGEEGSPGGESDDVVEWAAVDA